MKMAKPTNWVSMNGQPWATWEETMPCMDMVPAWITTPTVASTSGSS